MLSLDLCQICHQKCHFSVVKNAHFVKNCAVNPEVRQFRQISSKINVFATTATFCDFVSFSSKTKFFGAC